MGVSNGQGSEWWEQIVWLLLASSIDLQYPALIRYHILIYYVILVAIRRFDLPLINLHTGTYDRSAIVRLIGPYPTSEPYSDGTPFSH